MDSLKHILNANPAISTVYFNEAGEWMFFPRPGFDKKMDRADALKIKTLSEGEEAAKPNVSVDNPTGVGEAGAATDAALKKADDDVANFEIEKEIFAEQQAEFLAEKEAFEAAKKLAADSEANLKRAKDELAASKKANSDKDKAIADLKAKVATFEKAAKDTDNPLS